MHVAGFWTFMGAVLFIAIVAVVLSSGNTSTDLSSVGTAFKNLITTAEAG